MCWTSIRPSRRIFMCRAMMTDQEIADKLDMVRRTVQYKRAQSLKELKKEMEVTEDGAQSE